MGLFSGPTEPIDPALGLKLVASEQDLKGAHKILARNQTQIAADLGASGEELLLLAAGTFALRPGILAITSTRSTAYVKGKRDLEILHSDVHSTSLGQKQTGSMIVEIKTFKSELDFRSNDPKRYSSIIQIETQTQRPAQAICATVDNITGRK